MNCQLDPTLQSAHVDLHLLSSLAQPHHFGPLDGGQFELMGVLGDSPFKPRLVGGEVVPQICSPGEGLLTYFTDKVLDPVTGLVCGVHPLVVGKVSLVPEGFSTNIASEGFLSSVSPHVGDQVVLALELFLTN